MPRRTRKSCSSISPNPLDSWPGSTLQPPQLLPRFPLIVALERDDSMLRKRRRHAEQQRQQAREVKEMSGNENVARFAPQPIAKSRRRIVRLKIGHRFELGQSVTRPPELLSGLAGAKLAAVPHHGRPGAARGGFGRRMSGLPLSKGRQRPAGIDLRAHRVSVVNQKHSHSPDLCPA